LAQSGRGLRFGIFFGFRHLSRTGDHYMKLATRGVLVLGFLAGEAMAQTQPSLTGNPPQFYTYHAPAKTIDVSLPRPSVPLPSEMTRVFDGKTLKGWRQDPSASWMVKDGIVGSLGVGRGVLFTEKQYRHYRVVFDVRHVSGNPDHQACVLFFGLMPKPDHNAPDMLKAIQFQVPLGGTWDYRDGYHTSGKGASNGNAFDNFPRPPFDSHKWSRVEILINADTGTARMAVAQPVGSKAVEVGRFHVKAAGRVGPFALQMHNEGLFDEYANIAVEDNPKRDELITTE
jgi:Domain of Unknown Function (DUF1080)